MKMVKICMVPSNTLSSTDAGKFALKIIEAPIIEDYLMETHGLLKSLIAHVPNDTDWWDTVNKSSYCGMLARRHRQVKYEALMADKGLNWPDLSTYKGPIVLRFAYGDALKSPPLFAGPGAVSGLRSEIYEIKPNNANGNGERDARQKLIDIESSYVQFGLSGIYDRGKAYPAAVDRKKSITLVSKIAAVWKYLVNLWLLPLRVSVQEIAIEVERRADGVLLYRVCITLYRPDEMKKEEDWCVANFAVRMLYRINAMALGEPLPKEAYQYMGDFEPVQGLQIERSSIPRIIAGKDFKATPVLTLKPIAGKLCDEVKQSFDLIRDAMYSRLIGTPGERYMVCCDEAYFQDMIEEPKKQRLRSQTGYLGTAGAARTAAGFTMLGIPAAAGVTAAELMKRASELPADLARYLDRNPDAIVVFVAVAVIVTALLLVVVLSGGTAAVGAGALAGAATTTEVAAGGTVAGEVSVGMPTTIAAEVAPATAPATAVPDALVVSQETTSVPSLVTWAREAAARGVSRAALTESSSEKVAQDLLIKVLRETAVKQAIQKGVTAPVSGASVIALGTRPALAAGTGGASAPPEAPIPEGEPGGAAKLFPSAVGQMMIVPVNKVLGYPVTDYPEIYEQFDLELYRTPHLQEMPPAKNAVRKKYRFLGLFDVE